jgi:hypothetical protein
MKVTITNHHCDSRDIPVPGGGRIIRLPAFADIDVVFSSTEQLRGFASQLAIKAPAAHISIKDAKNVQHNGGAVASATDDIEIAIADSDDPAVIYPAPVLVTAPKEMNALKNRAYKPKKRGKI